MKGGYGASRSWRGMFCKYRRQLHHLSILELAEWLESGYHVAGQPFGHDPDARRVWIRYRCHSTAN